MSVAVLINLMIFYNNLVEKRVKYFNSIDLFCLWSHLQIKRYTFFSIADTFWVIFYQQIKIFFIFFIEKRRICVQNQYFIWRVLAGKRRFHHSLLSQHPFIGCESGNCNFLTLNGILRTVWHEVGKKIANFLCQMNPSRRWFGILNKSHR